MSKDRFVPDWMKPDGETTREESERNLDQKESFVPSWIEEIRSGSKTPQETVLSRKAAEAETLRNEASSSIPQAIRDMGAERDKSVRQTPTVIKNGKCVIPHQGVFDFDVYIKDGKIEALGYDISTEGCKVIDAEGDYVLPGVIDPHVHIGIFAPFHEEIVTESYSALKNGVTTLGVYIGGQGSYLKTIEEFLEKIQTKSYADVFVHLPIFTQEQLEEIPLLASRYGITSFKAYLCGIPGMIPSLDEGMLLDIMHAVKGIGNGGILNIHAENYHIVDWATKRMEEQKPEGIGVEDWVQTHPSYSETEAVQRAGFLARKTETPVYFVHISSAETLPLIEDLKGKRSAMFFETTSPYLALSSDSEKGWNFKMVPPIRMEKDRKELWRGVRDDLFDTIGTDHTPLTLRQKKTESNPWETVPGYPAVGTHLPFLLHEAQQEEVTLLKLSEKICYNPAKIFGLYPRKGTLMPGSDADLIIVDQYARRRVEPERAASRADFTLREGDMLNGWPRMIVKGGHVIDPEDSDMPQYIGHYVPRKSKREN